MPEVKQARKKVGVARISEMEKSITNILSVVVFVSYCLGVFVDLKILFVANVHTY